MNIKIRQENASDFKAVFHLIEAAFRNEEFSDKDEHFLVERLRASEAFIPELSLVAEIGDEIVGHILLTKLEIINGREVFDSLALAPVSVLPRYQRKGIGGKLIERAHEIAKGLNYESLILLGHQDYYPRFGYKPANEFNIELPFNAPAENCMAIELKENSLQGVSGMVKYPKEFYGDA